MHLDVGTFFILFPIAIGIGALASLLGLGGGIFMVPLLSLAAFVPTMQDAVGTSIAAVVFTSLSSSIAYWRRRAINVRIGLLLMPTTIAGAWAGARLTTYIEPRWLSIAFAAVLLYPVAIMLRGKTPKEIRLSLRGEATGLRLYAISAILGLVAGTGSGLLGIGGGTILVPTLAVFLGLDIVTSIATSLFVMAPSAIMASAQHWIQGHFHPELALPLILGIIIGAQVGPRIGTRIPKTRLRQLFGLVLLYAAVNMLLKGIR
jgi:uncharacterized membrane protein YfcA